jgi:hypothetical protein
VASPIDRAVAGQAGEALQNKDKAFVNEPAWSQLVGPF